MAAAPGTKLSRVRLVGRNAALLVDDDLHDLSLQGPVAADFLAQHVPEIRTLKYFHHMPATLFGRPVLISPHGLYRRAGLRDLLQSRRCGSHLGHRARRGQELGNHSGVLRDARHAASGKSALFYPYDMSQMYPTRRILRAILCGSLDSTSRSVRARQTSEAPRQHWRLKGKERFKIFGF